MPAETPRGRITLVGAGPGDPVLITLAGLRALQSADLVIYDRLVNPVLLEHAPQAEHLYIGKRPGEPHEATQGRINETMVREALAGRHVVRLKGGDPFIFGRGGEEMLAARGAGIEVRAIPGVTAALGAASGAGLPLTHRNIAGSVAFITGCPASERPRPHADWRRLAGTVDTLVLYMGVRHLAQIAVELMAGGLPPDHPVAAVERATLPDQRITLFTLDDLSRGAAEGRVEAPALVVIGEVVHVHEQIAAMAELALGRAS